ncbi:ABC transporter permease [Lysinibacillus xylanilyticus]|uniref:ABC transporter permease n=1 Tax=Lysinibacillus xylanilyticus TaxID=582475 RepID=UPI00381C6295
MVNSFLKQLNIEFKIYIRQPLYLLFSIVMPVANLIIFGSMYSQQKYSGQDFFSMFIPGFCVLILYATAVFNVGNQIVSDREKGIYKRILVTPITLARFVSAILIKALITAIASFSLILLTTNLLFNINFSFETIPFILGYFVMTIYALLVGIGISLLISKMTTYTSVMMGLFFPLFILSDAAIPIQLLPEWLQGISIVNPLYHANVILRSTWSEDMYQFYSNELWISYGALAIILIFVYILVMRKWSKRG